MKKIVSTNYAEDDISILIYQLEEIGKNLVYDFTSDDTADVNCIEENEDNYGNPVLIFEVTIRDMGESLGLVEVGINLDEDTDIDELTAWFEDEISQILDDAGVSRM